MQSNKLITQPYGWKGCIKHGFNQSYLHFIVVLLSQITQGPHLQQLWEGAWWVDEADWLHGSQLKHGVGEREATNESQGRDQGTGVHDTEVYTGGQTPRG